MAALFPQGVPGLNKVSLKLVSKDPWSSVPPPLLALMTSLYSPGEQEADWLAQHNSHTQEPLGSCVLLRLWVQPLCPPCPDLGFQGAVPGTLAWMS